MTPLGDALVAAQSRAVAALGKQYVGGQLHEDEVRVQFSQMGLTDPSDTDSLIAAWNVLRDTGAQAPGEAKSAANGEPRKSTPNQRAYIADLLRKGDFPPFAEQDLANLSHDRASEIITALKNGSYDPAVFDVPFE